jgi:hypothetical protein
MTAMPRHTHTLTEDEIDSAGAGRFDPARAQYVPGDPDAARRSISARVPEPTAAWIIDEAVRARVSPSWLIAELLGEAITARQAAGQGPRLVVDVADVHRLIDRIARAA